MICQRSACSALSELLGPERRRLDVDHPARHRRGPVGVRDVERRIQDRLMADAVGMHVSLVRQVHQVVDNQAVVALERIEGPALPHPFGPVVPVEIRDLRRVRERGIARPDPHQPVPLRHRIGTHASRRVDGLLCRHVGAAAGRVEHQPVISARDFVAVEPPHRQRQQPVPAGVLERRDLSVRVSPVFPTQGVSLRPEFAASVGLATITPGLKFPPPDRVAMWRVGRSQGDLHHGTRDQLFWCRHLMAGEMRP